MKNRATRRTKKKPYERPKLIEYGSLSQLTQAKGGRNADGRGRPRTRLRRRGA
jgi:hypothetical protein